MPTLSFKKFCEQFQNLSKKLNDDVLLDLYRTDDAMIYFRRLDRDDYTEEEYMDDDVSYPEEAHAILRSLYILPYRYMSAYKDTRFDEVSWKIFDKFLKGRIHVDRYYRILANLSYKSFSRQLAEIIVGKGTATNHIMDVIRKYAPDRQEEFKAYIVKRFPEFSKASFCKISLV